MDLVFSKELDWRKTTEWKANFVDSNRNNLALSVGYEVSFEVDFEKLQRLDTTESPVALSQFIESMICQLEAIVE